LTLPSALLEQEAHRARKKSQLEHCNLGGPLQGLRTHAAVARSEQVLSAYQKAFKGFTAEELSFLDGVVLEPGARRN
jgi:hypothetical protein